MSRLHKNVQYMVSLSWDHLIRENFFPVRHSWVHGVI